MGIVACIGTKADLFLLVFSHYTRAQSAVASLPCSRQKTDHTWLKAATQDVTQPTTCLVMKSFMVDLPFCLAMIPMIHMAAHCHMAFVNLCASSRPSPTFHFRLLDRSSVHHSWERHDGSLDGPWLAALNLRGALKATKLTAILWSPFHWAPTSWQVPDKVCEVTATWCLCKVARYLIAQMALSSGMMDEGFGA